MKIQRTKNAARNILYDGLLKTVNMVVPFVLRSVILHCLGAGYLGLNGLFRSILSFLNLAELGVGSAMVYCMYRPIAEDDAETICALMKLYWRLYRLIGLFIAAAGIALMPFLKYLIRDGLPQDTNLYILYSINLASTVLTYWLFAYKTCLLTAHQRSDVISKISLGVYLMEYTLKILALVFFRSYYLYLLIQLLKQAAINVFAAIRAGKLYPRYMPKGSLPGEKVRDIFRRVRALFTVKLSYVIFNAADTLVISSFMGLNALAVYQNYFYVITALRAFLDGFIGACAAGVGNSLVTESREKNCRDLHSLSLLYGWLMAVGSAMLLCVYQPFMRLWMGEENTLASGLAVCFTVYFYTMGMEKFLGTFKDAAGIWRKDRLRPLAAALVNLVLNLAAVKRLGLYGVLLSSIFAIAAVQVPWLLRNLFQAVFPREHLWAYTRRFCGLAAAAFAGCAASWFLCGQFSLAPWPSLFLNAGVSFLVPNALFLLLYGRNPDFLQTVGKIRRAVFAPAEAEREKEL